MFSKGTRVAWRVVSAPWVFQAILLRVLSVLLRGKNML